LSTPHNRRTFLKTSAMGLTAIAATDLTSAMHAEAPNPESANISVWVTSDKLRYAAGAPLKWRNAKGSEQGINDEPGKKLK